MLRRAPALRGLSYRVVRSPAAPARRTAARLTSTSTSSTSSSTGSGLLRLFIASAAVGAGASFTYSVFSAKSTRTAAATSSSTKDSGSDGSFPTIDDARSVTSKLPPGEVMAEALRGNSGLRFSDTPYPTDWVSVGSNAVCEDAHVAERISAPHHSGHWVFHAVFDGHLGPDTAHLLAKTLIGYVVRELTPLYAGAAGGVEPTDAAVAAAIQKAFRTADSALVEESMQELLAPVEGRTTPARAAELMATAIAGSCALVSFFDTRTRKLRVAVTGDSRAVLGQRPSGAGPEEWATIEMSEDQTPKLASERERIAHEHPQAGAIDTIIKDNRVLGLAVSRSFGDSHWKWPLAAQAAIRARWPDWEVPAEVRYGVSAAAPDPPYLVANPEVRSVVLPPEDAGADAFLILASDGLWDELSSERAVALVAEWCQWNQGAGLWADTPDDGQKTFEDRNNAAAHLFRNALGGRNAEKVAGAIAMKYPLSRDVRDDITVQVVRFGNVGGARPKPGAAWPSNPVVPAQAQTQTQIQHK